MAFHKSNSSNKKEIEYKIIDDYGVLSENKGYETRFVFMSWNGGEAKYDIRTFKDGVPKGGKNRLTGEECEKLYEIFKGIMGDNL